MLLGEFLINATSDVPLTTFSKTCVFTNNTGATLTSDDPADIQFRFADGDRFDARRQAEKLAAILHDPGFKASFPLIGIEVEYTHEVTVTKPDGSTETVPTVPSGIQVQLHYIGKAGATTAPQRVPDFSPSRMQQNGSEILDLDDDVRERWRNGFFEFLVDLGPALPIRASAKVP